MEPKPLPDQNYLRECFAYDPMTGILTWKERPRRHFTGRYCGWNKRHAGKPTSTRLNMGYQSVKIDHDRFLTHRIIWKWMTGKDPAEVLDHINRDTTDNRWANLRETTRTGNNQHALSGRKRKYNTYLPQGVYTDRGTIIAKIVVNRKAIRLGRFNTAQEAHEAYIAAKAQLHHFPFL
jgi:hypothetical protein